MKQRDLQYPVVLSRDRFIDALDVFHLPPGTGYPPANSRYAAAAAAS